MRPPALTLRPPQAARTATRGSGPPERASRAGKFASTRGRSARAAACASWPRIRERAAGRSPPPAPAPAPGSTCQAHGLLACASCKHLRRAACDCCQRGHHAVGHVVRRPMTERCGDHRMPACLECTRHQRCVRDCCLRHHRGQDLSPGGCSGPQSSVAKRARSASVKGRPELVDKRWRQQEG